MSNLCPHLYQMETSSKMPGLGTILRVYVWTKYNSPFFQTRTYPALKLTFFTNENRVFPNKNWKLLPTIHFQVLNFHRFGRLQRSGTTGLTFPQLPEDLWDSQIENKPHTNQLIIIEPTTPQWFRDALEVRTCQANSFVETTSSFLTRALSQRCEIEVFLVRKRLMISVEAFHYMSSMPHVSIHRKITITKSV